MNTGVFIKKGNLTTLIPNWKSLDKRTRWVFLDKWTQEDETIYLELSKDGYDTSIKPRIKMSTVGIGKELADKNREARRANKGKKRDFASFGGKRNRKNVTNEVESE